MLEFKPVRGGGRERVLVFDLDRRDEPVVMGLGQEGGEWSG